MENEERKKQALKLNHMSFHDGLTELYNRRYFEEALVRLDVLENLPITIAMGDINGLKAINELHGHKKGDALLKKTAEMLAGSFRESDIIARLGGDEFVVLMTRTDALQAELLINKFKEHSNRDKMTDMDLSISFGYETKRHIDEDIQDVLIKAEDSMYRFKLYESKSLRSKTIEVIMNALVEKSSRELMHSKRVSILCEKIAKHLYYKNEFINQIRIAGLVHDIGKIGIDEKILNKKSSLDESEWESIRKHPEAGWRILSSVKEFSELAEFIFSHHERWDGKGYPRGLRAEKIPVEARIITIADSYDAMTSNRSYRTRLSEDDAIEELKNKAGQQFDPEITKVFVEKVLEKKW
jgi:diguanylate cyclase (GGDEF)-like protein/putative nucleotidyltransferase with HDIG domain